MHAEKEFPHGVVESGNREGRARCGKWSPNSRLPTPNSQLPTPNSQLAQAQLLALATLHSAAPTLRLRQSRDSRRCVRTCVAARFLLSNRERIPTLLPPQPARIPFPSFFPCFCNVSPRSTFLCWCCAVGHCLLRAKWWKTPEALETRIKPPLLHPLSSYSRHPFR